MTTPTTTPTTTPMAAPQRCDRCVARAAFLAHVPGGGELMFCGHHHRRHRDRLVASGALVWALPVEEVAEAPDDAFL